MAVSPAPRPTATAAAPPLTQLLGALWLLDGALQVQPDMFRSDFVDNVLEPVKAGHQALWSTSSIGASICGT